MGDNIKKLLAKFDEGLSLAISKQEENDKTFKSTRDSAIKIADARIGIWPSDASVKTIGDLLGYVFPISGGVKNEPTMTYPTGGMTPEGDGYQQDKKSSEEIKKAYNNLNKYYNTAAKYSLPKLKEKGGGQFWFDYYMYYLIDFYLKNAEFVKLVKTDFEGPGEMSKLMTGDGSSIKHYSNFEIFDETIVIDSKYNSNNGLHRYLIYNLASAIVKDAADDLLFQALIEAGDSYTGPYTNDIKASKKSLVELLEIIPPEDKKEDKKEEKPVVPTNKEAVSTDNGVVKLKVALRGIQDGFQIKAKSDIPSFSIYAGDPDKDWPLLGVAIPEDGEDFEDVDGGFIDGEDLDSEYTESSFEGASEAELEFNPIEPFVLKPEPVGDDVNEEKGGSGTESIGALPAGLSANEAQKEAIKRARVAAGCKQKGKGACGRYTWNIAKNYHRFLKGLDGLKAQEGAGGNAKEAAYYNRLVKDLKYKQIANVSSTTKAKLKKSLSDTKWGVGDVVCYWSNDPHIWKNEKGNWEPSYRAYGHSQIYVGSISAAGWASDQIDNFSCSMVYGGAKITDDDWGYVAFRSPDVPSKS
jgi:hypothetical protein